jgi:hypothetical protein
MKTRFVYILALLFSFSAMVSCNKKAEETQNTTAAGPQEDLKASDLISNPNTANPQEVPAGPAPKMEFAESVFDFGDIKPGAVVKHTFKFKNTGDAPLIIESASASCGCTVPEWPREPIAAGAEGQINVEFNSQGKTGQQNKLVTIRANTQPNISELTIKANIAQ